MNAKSVAGSLAAVMTAAIFSLIIVGCGSRRGGDGSPAQPIVQPTVSPDPLATYLVDDPGCQTAAKRDLPLAKSTIHSWDGGQAVSKPVAFHDTRSFASLTSQAIAGTTYDDFYQRECDYARPSGHWCDDANGVEKSWLADRGRSGGPLRICNDGHAYHRLSYEGVALASAYFIQRARDTYQRLAVAAGAPAPQPIQLTVLPTFADDYDNVPIGDKAERLEAYITHNLAYFPVGQMIAVFPESAARSAKESGYFWESEFVLSHEYGHHLDYTRHGRVLSSIGLRWQPATHSYVDDEALSQGMSGRSNRAQIAGALAECFADMMGFYSEGGTSRSLVGIPDLGYNRNIINRRFVNGDEKILTEERLNLLVGVTEEQQVPWGWPVYSDIHTAGAIIAHAADQVFQRLTASNAALVKGSREEIDERYKLTLAWMDTLVAQMSQLTLEDTGDRILSPIGAAFKATEDAYLGKLGLTDGTATREVRSDVCATVKEALPTVVSDVCS